MNVMSNSGFETVSFEQFHCDIRETAFSGTMYGCRKCSALNAKKQLGIQV